MVQTAEQNRENKTVFDELRRYVAFNVLGMAGLSCYILADTFFVSFGLGADGLTALNLAIPVYSLIHGCALMLGMGGATKYAVFRGQRAFKNAERVFMNTVLAAAVSAIFFAAAGLLCSKTLAGLLGADDTIFAMTEIYLRVLLLFSRAGLSVYLPAPHGDLWSGPGDRFFTGHRYGDSVTPLAAGGMRPEFQASETGIAAYAPDTGPGTSFTRHRGGIRRCDDYFQFPYSGA